MRTADRASTRRYPLHVTIAVAFAALLTLLGFSLIGFNYLEGRKNALQEADDLLQRINAHMQLSVEGLYAPIQNVVDVASKTLPANSDATDHGVRSLGFASEVLRIKPEISSIFVGYDDGDFYLLRHVDSWPGIDRVVEVPEGARFVLESLLTTGPAAPSKEWLFYDDDLAQVGRETTAGTGFDPRNREWYRRAMESSGQIATEFYRFFTTGELGVTVARRLAGGQGVVGADLTLEELSAGLREQQPTPSSRIAMLEPNGRVIALPDLAKELAGLETSNASAVEMPHLTDLDDPVYHQLAAHLTEGRHEGRVELTVDGQVWLASLSRLPTRWGESIILATIVPRNELLTNVVRLRDRSVLISLGLLLVALLVVIRLARHISGSLGKLARAAEQIRELRLNTPLRVRSSIQEVDELAATMELMQSSLQRFLSISHGLSAERDFDRLLEMILEEARRVSGAEGGAILLCSKDGDQLDVAILQLTETGKESSQRKTRCQPVPLDPADGLPTVEGRSTRDRSVVRIDDVAADHGYDLAGVRERFEAKRTRVRSVMCVPLLNPQGDVIGTLQLVNSKGPNGEATRFRDETVPYIEALSSNAAIALDNRRLLQAQKDLLQAFIHVVAGAIDAKSPYTHGHCQRVPVIARMLAEAAHQSETWPFSDFELSDDDSYALHLASWLHDCGKVTTPEYVVDKASKLETIYNRIHEIRMRFEVLLRDAEIEYLKGLRDEESNEPALLRQLQERRAVIRDDFAFLAECNSGDTPMSDERLDRLKTIGSRTWMRHLDDRLGLSHGELLRRDSDSPEAFPVEEPLLADKPEHVVQRAQGSHPFGDNQHGFSMDVPDLLYNQGEVYNLCILRGTLTNEERFKINEHVVQTIRMLGRLPFPRELSHVPDWAGNHHEKFDGTGYPRRIQASTLSIPERILAVADVFEALTAMDRPYLPPKKLSHALGIMSSMCDGGHLCPELFELLLTSGVFRRYADEYMQPQQVDDVDVHAVLRPGQRNVS